MQPNQQDPNQNQPTSPPDPNVPAPSSQPYSNVPDYLHMEPVADPVIEARKRKKKISIILILVGLFITLSLVSIAVYLFFSRNTPENAFHRTLEAQLNEKYVTRRMSIEIEQANANSTKESISTDVDLSDPRLPKSSSVYENNATEDRYKRHINVIAKSEKKYTILKEWPLQRRYGLVLNQWYEIDVGTDSNNKAEEIVQAHDLVARVGTPLGLFIQGNFSDDEKTQIIETIRQEQPYVVKSSETKPREGKTLTQYVVSVDWQKLDNVNKKLSNRYKVSMPIPYSIYGTKADVEFLVDNDTGNVVHSSYSVENLASKSKQTVLTSYMYPTSINVTAPQGAKNVTTK